ncbi:PorV/PorQ family protein [bacterium]|nr:PorV/PorQ family protein [bacterium]
MRTRFIYLTVVLILLLLISNVYADRSRAGVLFLLIGPGARPTGMGEAFVAIADDATAAYWNPAGLGLYPLSSKWYSFPAPPAEKIDAIGLTKGSVFQQGYKKHNLWMTAGNKLYVQRKDEWKDYEEYTTIEGETLKDVVEAYVNFATIDSSIVNSSIIPKIINYNKLPVSSIYDTLPSEIKIKIPFSSFIPDSITALCISNKKALLVGTNNGLYSYQDKWDKVDNSGSPKDNFVRVMVEDESGGIWVGTDDGLYVKRGAKWVRYSTVEGMPGNDINALYVVSPYKAWAAAGKDLAIYEGRDWQRYYTYTVTPEKTWMDITTEIFPVSGTRKRELIAAELMAANSVQDPDFNAVPKDKEIKIPYKLAFEGDINSIYQDENLTVWFGTEYGIKSFDGAKWTYYGYNSENIDAEANISDWVSKKWPELESALQEKLTSKIRVYNQLNETSIKAGTVIEYPSNPASAESYCVSAGPGNNILVGTEYGTLIYKSKDDRFKYYDISGLHKEEVHNIVGIGKDFWFQTDDEVKVYSKGNKELTFMHVQWLPTLADDIYYEFFSTTYYLEGWGTFGGSIIFISEGENIWTDESGEILGTFHSYELAVGLSYGTTIIEDLALGMNFKVIHSHLVPRNIRVGREEGTGVATVFAVDGGLHYQFPWIDGLSAGLTVQNVGPSIHYIDYEQRDPLPRNLKLGLAYKVLNTEYNVLTLAADINKDLIDIGGEDLEREAREMVKNLGVEYTYSNLISLRGGYLIDYDYHYDPASDSWKGTHYMTFGAGLRYTNYQFDFAYIPEQVGDDDSTLPLSNIMRFSLLVRF